MNKKKQYLICSSCGTKAHVRYMATIILGEYRIGYLITCNPYSTNNTCFEDTINKLEKQNLEYLLDA